MPRHIRGLLLALSEFTEYCRKCNVLTGLRWSYGANRVQIEADVKVLSEFLSYLQTDSVRASLSISSLSPVQLTSRATRWCFLSLDDAS